MKEYRLGYEIIRKSDNVLLETKQVSFQASDDHDAACQFAKYFLETSEEYRKNGTTRRLLPCQIYDNGQFISDSVFPLFNLIFDEVDRLQRK